MPPMYWKMESGDMFLMYMKHGKVAGVTLKKSYVEIYDLEKAVDVLNGIPSTYEWLIASLDALGTYDRRFTLKFVNVRLI